jgi:hypothetical protein
MKLQDRLPDSVTVDGKRYALDLDFRNVLRMLETLSRDDMMPEAREYNALACVVKRPKNVHNVLRAIRSMLFQKPPETDARRVTDFVQDAGLIRAAFRQAYGIDLYRDRVHWIEFTELLNAIPEGSRYTEVLGIRSRPMPAPTRWNAAEREWLAKAKASVALDVDEQEAAEQYQKDVHAIATMLIAWAKGSKNE